MNKKHCLFVATLCCVALGCTMLCSSCKDDTVIEDPVIVDVKHSPEEKEFIQNWENMQMVTIYNSSTGSFTRVNTPWNKEARVSTIPVQIANDVKKEDGWEVVFTSLSDAGVDGANYFGLYNYRLGIFRIFAYLDKPIGTGNESVFDVSVGPQESPLSMFPLYNALPYAVPTEYKNLNLSMDFFGKGTGNTFRVYTSPYTTASQTTESAGWTCFDVDMSGYNPNPTVQWPTTQYSQMISIRGANRDKTTITLAGTVTSKTTGKFVEQIPVKTISSGGIGSVFNAIGSFAKGGVAQFICGLLNNKTFTENVKTIGTVLQVAGSVAEEARKDAAKGEKDPEAAKKVMDGMMGKLELSTTGEVNLNGYLSKDVVSSFKPLQFANAYVHVDNPSSHFGQGVWGLATSPIIYIVDDVMMGEKERINLFRPKGKKEYGNTEIESYGLRMIQFLDPYSINVNLNTNIFSGADSVKVSYCYGVYPNEPKGHTAPYAKLLQLERPDVKIFKDDNTIIYNSRNPKNDIQYAQLTTSSLMEKDLGETTDNYNINIKQVGANYKYCGNAINDFGKTFIVDPQVYFPVTVEPTKTSLYDGECPDFVVVVTLSFRHNGRYYVFTERYLPQIKKISRKDLKAKRIDLDNYISTCKNNSPFGRLYNDQKYDVFHTGNEAIVYRTVKMLRAIEN